MTKTHEAAGPVASPLPMNPASRVFPAVNPNVINLETGAWAHWREVRLVTDDHAAELRDHWRAKYREGW